jgi:adenylate cyclase
MADEPELTAEQFEAAGLYDPDGEHAADQLALLEFLVDCGATMDDLIEGRDELPVVASSAALRTGKERLTVGDLAARADLDPQVATQIWRAAGFADPDPEARVFSEAEAELVATFHEAEQLMDRQAILQLIRVMGSAMARVADAMVSAFVVNVAPTAAGDDPVGLELARANALTAGLVPQASRFLDVLLRRHMQAMRQPRAGLDVGAPGYETQRLVVGFADLVDSTALVQELPMAELGAAITDFEGVASDVVTAAGGRLVKLIGDEAMFVVPGVAAACDIGLTLAELVGAHPALRGLRVAVAAGDVLSRDGDYYGPTVNLAARAVKLAPPGGLVAPADAVAELDAGAPGRFRTQNLGERAVAGFAEPVELCRVTRYNS